MRNVILFLALLCLVAWIKRPDDVSSNGKDTGKAHGKANGFMGIPWGSTPDQATKELTARQGMKFFGEQTGAVVRVLFFQNGEIDGLKVNNARFHFLNNFFYWGCAEFKGISEFDKLKADLTKQFGQPRSGNMYASWKLDQESIILTATDFGDIILTFTDEAVAIKVPDRHPETNNFWMF